MAHVEVSPTELPESSSQELVFSYHHGCDGLATDGLEILLPEGVEATSMGGPEGWQSTIEERDAGQVMVWSGPEVPDGVEAEYPVELDLPAGAGTTLYFPTIQRCGPDDQVRWVEIPAEGQDPGELAEPAPAVLLVDNPDATTSTAVETTDGPRPPPRRRRPPPRRSHHRGPPTPRLRVPSSTASATTIPPSPSTTTAESESGGRHPRGACGRRRSGGGRRCFALARSRNKQ